LGGFCALVYLMRDLGQHLRRDYNPLSADLPGHSTTQLDGDYAAALAALARFTRERHARNPDFQQTPPALSVRAAILQALLNELEGAEFAVANQRICLTPLRKLWIGWRTSRRSAGAGR
jgi:phytoene synthase